jgi:hypothetical protein
MVVLLDQCPPLSRFWRLVFKVAWHFGRIEFVTNIPESPPIDHVLAEDVSRFDVNQAAIHAGASINL